MTAPTHRRNLTRRQAMTLDYIKRQGRPTTGNIANFLQLTGGEALRTLEALERAGFLTRERITTPGTYTSFWSLRNA